MNILKTRAGMYYGIALGLYILEMVIVYLLSLVFLREIVLANYLIRLTFSALGAFLLKRFAYQSAERFYYKFAFIMGLIPLVSSSSLYIGLKLFDYNVMFIKLGADIIASFVGYSVLKGLTRDTE